MKKLLLLGTLFISSIINANAQGVSSANLTSSATLNGSCVIDIQNVDIGSATLNAETIIKEKINFICSKDMVASIGMTSSNSSSTNNFHHYLVGSNPSNTDKIVYVVGNAAHKYPTDGSPATGPISFYRGSGISTSLPSLIRITVVGSIVDDVFYSNDFKITPDTYSSNITVTLTY